MVFAACGAEERRVGFEPLAHDYVLSVFEVGATASGPCGALASSACERVASLEMDVRHQSGQHGVDSVVGLEGAWGTGRVLVVHRRVGAGLSAPWVCLAIELR